MGPRGDGFPASGPGGHLCSQAEDAGLRFGSWETCLCVCVPAPLLRRTGGWKKGTARKVHPISPGPQRAPKSLGIGRGITRLPAGCRPAPPPPPPLLFLEPCSCCLTDEAAIVLCPHPHLHLLAFLSSANSFRKLTNYPYPLCPQCQPCLFSRRSDGRVVQDGALRGVGGQCPRREMPKKGKEFRLPEGLSTLLNSPCFQAASSSSRKPSLIAPHLSFQLGILGWSS